MPLNDRVSTTLAAAWHSLCNAFFTRLLRSGKAHACSPTITWKSLEVPRPEVPRPKASAYEPRASWKGRLAIDLVSLPVAAYNVTARREGEIHFHQLHAACHSRIRHEKVCPIHGAVPAEEVVSGYEFEPDQYVELHAEEIEKLRSHADQQLTIERFVPPAAIETIFYDGRAYFLVPDSEDAIEPYEILLSAIRHKGLLAVGEVVFSGRDQLVVVKPFDGMLTMQMLNYQHQLRPAKQFSARFSNPREDFLPLQDDLAIAEELIDALADDDFQMDEYEDAYEAKLRALIDAKLAGEEIVAPPHAEHQPRVINLHDALRRSVDRARSGAIQRYRT